MGDMFVTAVLVTATVVIFSLSIASAIDIFTDMEIESPVRKWRKLNTPSCGQCAFSRPNGRCMCPAAIEYKSRMTGVLDAKALTYEVRGTRRCRFTARTDSTTEVVEE